MLDRRTLESRSSVRKFGGDGGLNGGLEGAGGRRSEGPQTPLFGVLGTTRPGARWAVSDLWKTLRPNQIASVRCLMLHQAGRRDICHPNDVRRYSRRTSSDVLVMPPSGPASCCVRTASAARRRSPRSRPSLEQIALTSADRSTSRAAQLAGFVKIEACERLLVPVEIHPRHLTDRAPP
jgi:hypothetical protein